MKTYRIKEIFGPTIQGEGSYIGAPVLFLRFAGCNRWSGKPKHKPASVCSFCDTDFVGGDELTAEEIVLRLRDCSNTVTRVVLSGGEPALQVDHQLCEALHQGGFQLHLETNGSIDIGDLANRFHWISMSPKQNLKLTRLRYADEVKLLYPWIDPEITLKLFGSFPTKNWFLQPVHGVGEKGVLDILYKNPTMRVSPQLHKLMEVP